MRTPVRGFSAICFSFSYPSRSALYTTRRPTGRRSAAWGGRAPSATGWPDSRGSTRSSASSRRLPVLADPVSLVLAGRLLLARHELGQRPHLTQLLGPVRLERVGHLAGP